MFNDHPLLGVRDIAAVCELHPSDFGRGYSSTYFPPWVVCRTDKNQVVLNAYFGTASDKAWRTW